MNVRHYAVGLYTSVKVSLGAAVAVAMLAGCGGAEVTGASSVDESQLSEAGRQTVFERLVLPVASGIYTPEAAAALQSDAALFSNTGFESGVNGWHNCAGSNGVSESADSFEGEKALQLSAGNCIYQSAIVQPADQVLLECAVKIADMSLWAGMGLGFASEDWKVLDKTPARIIENQEYTVYRIQAVVPDDAKFASMWLYSDSGATVDACSLTSLQTPESETETTVPETSEPQANEPENTEPGVTEPETTEPETTDPETTEPETTEPETTVPETTGTSPAIALEITNLNYQNAAGSDPVKVVVTNTGDVNLTEVAVSSEFAPDCVRTIDGLQPEESETYNCRSGGLAAGELRESVFNVSASSALGNVTDTGSIERYRSSDLQMVLSMGTQGKTIAGQPGETVSIPVALSNIGYFPITSITTPIVSLNNAGVSIAGAEACRAEFAALVQGFLLLPGETRTVSCDFVVPTDLEPFDLANPYGDNMQRRINIRMDYGNESLSDNYSRASDGRGVISALRVNEPQVEAQADSWNSTATDNVMDASFNPPELEQLLNFGDFEELDATGYPAGWENACAGTSASAETIYGRGLGLFSDACASSVLDSNALAALAGKTFTLSCAAVSGRTGASSSVAEVSIFLNGEGTTAFQSASHRNIVLTGKAPDVLTDGFVSIYANDSRVFDDCKLTIHTPVNGGASISVSNQLPGNDWYETPTLDYVFRVENTGSVPLTDVQVWSDKLACKALVGELGAGETRDLMCEGAPVLSRWDESFYHAAITSARTPTGELITDMDFAGHQIRSFYIYTSNYISFYAGAEQNERSVTVTQGDSLTVNVQYANSSGDPVTALHSNLESCSRVIDPPLQFAQVISYSCVIENIQEGIFMNLSAYSANHGNIILGTGLSIRVE